MLGLSLAMLLVAASIAVFPCWRHSADWGYGPSAVAGGLLVLIAAVTVSDHGAASSSLQTPTRIVAQRV
jgi:hypothetical protein